MTTTLELRYSFMQLHDHGTAMLASIAILLGRGPAEGTEIMLRVALARTAEVLGSELQQLVVDGEVEFLSAGVTLAEVQQAGEVATSLLEQAKHLRRRPIASQNKPEESP